MAFYKTVNIRSGFSKHSRSSVLIIYTGGTIGMDYDPETGALAPFDFEQIMEKVPELHRFNFDITVLSLEPLIDSSDASPAFWKVLCKLIQSFYEEYEGFVILHGTDTMAYSASALSFMIDNLSKPVVFTGSQLPIGVTRTDARDNLIGALQVAAARNEIGVLVPEVCIFFESVLLRGNRSKKVQNFDFTAFESYNYPPLAKAGIDFDFSNSNMLSSSARPCEYRMEMDQNIGVIKLYPGICKAMVKGILNTEGLKGLVLETFGSGNAPTSQWFLSAIKEAVDLGVVVLNISQCTGGKVQLGKYSTSAGLKKAGVISGGDMTIEAATVKLMYLLANYSIAEVKILLLQSLRGELSD